MAAAVPLAALSTAQLTRTRTLVGAWAKISILQYFIAEAVVIAAWAGPTAYSRRFNVISDLGAEYCGVYSGRAVCSPLHRLMDASFIVQGLAMIIGAVLLSSVLFRVAGKPGLPGLPPVRGWPVAVRALIGVSGLGTIVVGLVPEDTISSLHYAGAVLFFIAGGLSLVVLGWNWRRRRLISAFLLLCGVVSLISTVVFALVPGIEVGTVERLMAYPITIGLSVVGMVMARGCQQARASVREHALA
ncbi:DUF998 domain-containing protein [Paeniglutamicibacter antarcticus]|uniref:DUF998 domain-containing protein n=2 Tax=Arthrobacter terrae TaxID=2935737 RepID=A0A931G7V8_9MICC|nr:DUF998 domain-containing protein [Arthrobacter terrae]